MLFDNADNPAQEPATPAATSAATDPKPTETTTEGAELDLIETPEPDEVEEELEGVKIKGNRDALGRFKSERMMHGDYTRKTMEIAEHRKALESERESFRQTAQLHQTFLREAAQMQTVDDRLQAFQKLDWNALIAQDATQAQKLQIEFSQLQAMRQQLAGSLTQKQQQLQQAQQQEIAKRARDAQAFLQREIKDWSPQKDAELEGYARSLGLNSQQLAQFMLHQPAIALALDKARQFDQLKKQVAAKPRTEQLPKPVTKVGGSSASNTKLPSEMSPAEYAAWRQERKSKR
jgi:hypothetical protein